MKICFYGVGGVGGYFGGIAAHYLKSNHTIYFVARGQHKEAICKSGLTLKLDGGRQILDVHPELCTDKVEELPVFDLIFVAVKSNDLPEVAHQISRIANAGTIILPLLNGVDIYERFREHCKTGIVLPACVYVGTHIESPGVIFQKGGAAKILMGYDPQYPAKIPYKLFEILEETGIQYSWEENVQQAIWSKYMFIAAFGMVTAAYHLTLGQIVEDEKYSKLTKYIMEEISNLAKAKQIGLPENIVAESFQKASQFPYEAKTSFQRDVEIKGKPNEADLFGGTIIRLGKELGIETPFTNAVYKRLL